MISGCQWCQWGLKMRVDCAPLYSSNGQADGRLLCSLCLGWWLYSSGGPASLQPCVRPRFIELSSPQHAPLLFSRAVIYLSFHFSLHIFSSLPSLRAGSICRAIWKAVSFQPEAVKLGGSGALSPCLFDYSSAFSFNFTVLCVKAHV